MKYRTYRLVLRGLLVFCAIGLAGCAGQGRNPGSIDQTDGHEPQQRPADTDISWLGSVEQGFGKVAARSSNRTLASNKMELLFDKKKISFYFKRSQNQFFLTLKGATYQMQNNSLDDGDTYSFAAVGADENPPALIVTGLRDFRKPASSKGCDISVSSFDKGKSAYVEQKFSVAPFGCKKMIKVFKDYVP